MKKKEITLPLPPTVLVEFALSELKTEGRDNYLLEIMVHPEYSEFHIGEKGGLRFYYRKPLGEKPVKLSRREFKSLLEGEQSSGPFGYIVYSFAFRGRNLVDIISSETWGKRSDAIRYEAKIQKGGLKVIKNSVDLVWHAKGK